MVFTATYGYRNGTSARPVGQHWGTPPSSPPPGQWHCFWATHSCSPSGLGMYPDCRNPRGAVPAHLAYATKPKMQLGERDALAAVQKNLRLQIFKRLTKQPHRGASFNLQGWTYKQFRHTTAKAGMQCGKYVLGKAREGDPMAMGWVGKPTKIIPASRAPATHVS